MGLNIPTHMDFEGQRLAEKISHIIVVLFGAVGWVVGYVNQQFSHTVLVLGAGVLLAALITLPPWPMFRRKPVAWRKVKKETSIENQKESKETSSPSAKQKKKSNKA